VIGYGPDKVKISMAGEPRKIDIGHALFTDAGSRLAKLTDAKTIPEFLNYALEKMRAAGCKVEVL
jgi:hypothetical protein